MTSIPTAPASIACPRCQAANAPAARFCGVCGAPMQGNAAPPPMPAPPPPPAPPMRNPRLMMGGASPTQAVINADPAAAFEMALQAIRAAGGEILWQGPPASAKFMMGERSLGIKFNFKGDLSLAPSGPRQSIARVSLKVEPSAIATMLCFNFVSIVIGAMFLLQVGLILAIIASLFSLWTLVSRMPADMAEKVMMAIPQAPPAWAAAPPVPTAMPHVAPPPLPGASFAPRPAPPPLPPEPAAHAAGTDAIGQLKALADLRDLGAVTPEEFEAKKAELLKRL